MVIGVSFTLYLVKNIIKSTIHCSKDTAFVLSLPFAAFAVIAIFFVISYVVTHDEGIADKLLKEDEMNFKIPSSNEFLKKLNELDDNQFDSIYKKLIDEIDGKNNKGNQKERH